MKSKPGCSFEMEIRLEEAAGLVPVKVTRIGDVPRATLTAPVIPHAAKASMPIREQAARAVDLNPGDIGFAGHDIGVWQGGPAFLYIPIATREALARARPIEPCWSEAIGIAGTDGAYLYARGGDGARTDYRARMFAPTAGIPEDPATGSATAILAAQLLASKALVSGTSRLNLEQGYEMGRPSDLALEIDVVGGALSEVRVAGQAVRIARGTIEI